MGGTLSGKAGLPFTMVTWAHYQHGTGRDTQGHSPAARGQPASATPASGTSVPMDSQVEPKVNATSTADQT